MLALKESLNASKQLKQMQFLKRSSSNTLKRHTSETMIHNRAYSRMQQVYSPASHTPIYKHNNQPSILANLFPRKPSTNLKKVLGKVHRRNKQILGETEERIFSEVLGLMSEIDELREKIAHTYEEVKELSIAYPEIEEKVAFHGYDQQLTRDQCAQVEDENYRLERLIREVEASQINGLEDVLRIQRQRYEELKRDLNENKMTNSANLQQRIKSLKASITGLETQRHSKIRSSYPEFEDLKNQNDVLRQKTIANLIHGKTIREQEQALQQFLMNDEVNRQEFMRELQSWKDGFKRVKAENQALKLRLLRKEKVDSKENQNSNVYRSKAASNKMLGIESQIKRKEDRLSEYSTLIRRMQSLNK